MSASFSSFTQKILRITMTLVDGTAPKNATNANSLILQGLRASCSIKKMGHPSKNTCKLKIYGMTEDQMNAATVIPNQQTILKYPASKKVYLLVEAGDANGLSLAFAGEITSAWANYHSPPNLYFQVEAVTGHFPSLKPATPVSYRGGVDGALVVQNLAASIGYGFQNNGFSGNLSNPYLTGTAIDQIRQVAAALPMELQIDDLMVCIAPKNVPRIPAGQVPLLSAQTGMKEYPVFDKHGLKVQTLFIPNLQLGGQFKVQSYLGTIANGYWFIQTLEHELESNNPHGHWITKIGASRLKNPPAGVQAAEGEGA